MPINRSCRAHFYCVLCVFAHWDGLPAKTALRSHGLSLSLSLHLHIVDDRESHLPIWYYWCWQRLFVFAFHAKCWLMALPGLTFLLCVHPLLLISPRFLSLCLHKIISAPRLSYQSHVGFSECHIGLFHTINSNRQQRQPTTAMWSDVIVICGSLIISMCQYVWLWRVFFRLSFLFSTSFALRIDWTHGSRSHRPHYVVAAGVRLACTGVAGSKTATTALTAVIVSGCVLCVAYISLDLVCESRR